MSTRWTVTDATLRHAPDQPGQFVAAARTELDERGRRIDAREDLAGGLECPLRPGDACWQLADRPKSAEPSGS
jgi:hypothetical protein